MCVLSNNAYVTAACVGCVTIYSTGGKFRLVSNFTQLHALTLAACSYSLDVTQEAAGAFFMLFLCTCIQGALRRMEYVAVPGRNQTLFSCVFRPCYRVRSAVVQYFR